MSVGFFSVASSSSGNSYILFTEEAGIVLDVGVSGKKIKEALNGYGIPFDLIKGILITHEHIDHVKSVRIATKTFENAKVYCSNGTEKGSSRIRELPSDRKQIVSAGDSFYIGDILVKTFSLSHDAAEPIGFSFEKDDIKITVVTDTGLVTDEMLKEMCDSDILLLESNHEVRMLEMSSYPYQTKRRILGDLGHLSNETAGIALCEAMKRRSKKTVPDVILGHISSENNTYKLARLAIKNILEENDIIVGKDINVGIATKNENSKLYRVNNEH